MYLDYEERGIRKTIVSFDPFFKMEAVRGLSDAKIGKKFGIATQTVKDMRRHFDVPFDTIRILCHELDCQPGDILNASTVYVIPAKNENLIP